ncbi:type III secretory pathway component EscV [Halarchaeum rubridurum]|uniref:Type III secretory pathway component EscV n=1 Tax=Halarchaeum rubridurum TaxID=489911 RepID=A0A830FK83_9EURY|nr:hypothetical protein [Halarchaeum rubridurum]MBP1954270.1 type III secretory pathway component EscV [Halarchaeum rubridurum]GGM58738.1 hypothetical protein GCM10009017_06040 [Halarchaeum rubridurum]
MRAHSVLSTVATVALVLALGTIGGWLPVPDFLVIFLLGITVCLAVVLFFLTAYRMTQGVFADENPV